MSRRFWMFIHDQAEKLWHYAYYKANPPEKREPFTYRYMITYLNVVADPLLQEREKPQTPTTFPHNPQSK